MITLYATVNTTGDHENEMLGKAVCRECQLKTAPVSYA